ncbi:MAG: hypothetical protein WBV33_14365, partial [Terracidiphilus sp.]
MNPFSLLPLRIFTGVFLLLSAVALCCPAQQAPPPQQSPQPGASGIAGGIGAPNQYDQQHRPITMGGFVQPGQAPVVFEDITKQAGLSGWIHKMGSPEKNFIVETNGSGVCIIDYN